MFALTCKSVFFLVTPYLIPVTNTSPIALFQRWILLKVGRNLSVRSICTFYRSAKWGLEGLEGFLQGYTATEAHWKEENLNSLTSGPALFPKDHGIFFAQSLYCDPILLGLKSIKSTFFAPSVTWLVSGRHTSSVTKLEEKFPCYWF